MRISNDRELIVAGPYPASSKSGYNPQSIGPLL